MHRRVVVAGILAGLVISGSADLSACGDKFLRVGRSARYRGYAAVHPASILIYTPVNSKPAGIKELEELLKRAGHTPLAVKNGASLSLRPSTACATILSLRHTPMRGRSRNSSRPFHQGPTCCRSWTQPTKAIVGEAEKSYPFVLDTRAMNKFEALAEIDHLMSQRLKASHAAAAIR